MNVTYSCKGLFLKIFIDGKPHLMIKLQDLKGFQSWINTEDWFAIEFYMKDCVVILCEYDNRTVWNSILELLNEKLQ